MAGDYLRFQAWGHFVTNLVFGQDGKVADWVASQIDHVDGFIAYAAIGIERDGELVGGVVYHENRGNDIQISCAASKAHWLSQGSLRALFYYPFMQLKVDRMTAFTPSRSKGTRRFLSHLGFVQEGIMRQGFKGDDCIIYGMLRDECKWIKGLNHG